MNYDMDKRKMDLYRSLVGSSIDYSFKRNVDNILTTEKNIRAAKKEISRDIANAFSVGGEYCIMLLAELTNYYRNKIFYMAVRSSIVMRRYRPAVLDYLGTDVSDRVDKLVTALEDKKSSKVRDIILSATKYLVRTYPSRLKSFKDVLTREEYINIA